VIFDANVINGGGLLDDHHGPSAILCDTVTLVFTLFRYFANGVFIYSDFRWHFVSLLRYGSQYCFCLVIVALVTIVT